MRQCFSFRRGGFPFSPFRRVMAATCAFMLVVGLLPLAPAYGEEMPAVDDTTVSTEMLLAVGPYVEGEALVVYRADVARSNFRSLDTVDPMAAAGFSVEDAWDFSGVDAVATESDTASAQTVSTFALADESADQGSESDARILRVTKAGASTASLLEDLGDVEGVVAVAPNYVRELATDAPLAAADAAGVTVLTGAAVEGADATSPTVAEVVVGGTDVLSVNGAEPVTTNDPLARFQWSLDNNIFLAGTAAESDIDFASAYQQAKSGTETIVAVLDDGVDYNNEDLKAAMWSNPGTIDGVPGNAGSHGYDFVSGDDDSSPEAQDSHGTHCAGIMAATSGNGIGISGVSPKTKIMAFRIGGTETGGNMNDGAVLASYEFLLRAKLAGENVVAASNSWGGILSPVVEYAINQAGRAGVLTVFAAGNDNIGANSVIDGKVSYGLSESPYVLMVAATSLQGAYASYTSHDAYAVDVTAPGSVMLSTVAENTFQPAVAKALDENAGTPGVHSLYYHSMVDIDNNGAVVALRDASGTQPDQSRLDTTTTVGLDGREALGVSVEDMTKDEYVGVVWRIENPFKGMTWEQASQVCVSVLPGVAASGASANAATYAAAWPLLLSEEGSNLLNDGQVVALVDNLGGQPAKLASEEAFDSIRNVDTLRVGVEVAAVLEGTGVASLTLTDFGIGFPDGLGYQYSSGTSMACPLVAGAIGLVASVYPDASALEVRGRIVGGTKPLHDAASGDYPACASNWDQRGNPKQTASSGALDLSVAMGSEVRPSTWGARASDDGEAVELEGYRLDRVSELFLDGVVVDRSLWSASRSGLRLIVRQSALLDGGRHVVEVSDGAAIHRGTYAFPLVGQDLSFQKVTDMPDVVLPDEVGFDSGILVGAADRLFCLDSKGRYLYSYDPEGSGGWTACQAPVDAGFTVLDFRTDTTVAYADGKLYATVQYDQETGNKESPVTLLLAVVSYDIATDSWDTERLDFVGSDVDSAGAHFGSVALAACEGDVYLNAGGASTRGVARYNPRTGDGGTVVEDDESDPSGSFRSLCSAPRVPLVAVGDELRFLGYAAAGVDEVSGQQLYALALGTYDGQTFDVLPIDANAPRFGEDEMDVLSVYAGQACAATGDSLVFTGASAGGLGDTYQVNLETGEWTPLGVRAPGDGSAAVSTACFFQGTYYVLAESENVQGQPTTALYRLPEEVSLMANDHVASAQASAGGTVEVTYGAGLRTMTRASAGADVGASSQVEHVALGDTVTWNAVASAGYEFSGWYDGAGMLVGDKASYSQSVTSDVVLSARFTPAVDPGSGSDPQPDPDPMPIVLPSADIAAKPLASTGDGIGVPLVFFMALVGVVSACLLATTVLRRRGRWFFPMSGGDR